jgi:hypothetical protein
LIELFQEGEKVTYKRELNFRFRDTRKMRIYNFKKYVKQDFVTIVYFKINMIPDRIANCQAINNVTSFYLQKENNVTSFLPLLPLTSTSTYIALPFLTRKNRNFI